MFERISTATLAGAVAFCIMGAAAQADTVKVTPLGSHDGEFCVLDRAMIFEDPDGTRILYDAGRTVAGPDDPRLGEIDAVLLSHVHGDHLGDRHIEAVNEGECGAPQFPIRVTPNSNTVNIVMGKQARLIVGSEMAGFFANRIQSLGGDPGLVGLVRYGASVTVGGVRITTVPAVHSNGLAGAFIGGELGDSLAAVGLTAYVGPANGYVLIFSNGLTVYLSGDTGVTSEQETVVRRQYGAQLAVINIGDTFTTGPTEAAFVINELVRPVAVIPSHANEPATENGQVRAGTRTERFATATYVPVHIPRSGQTMEFDSAGSCVATC